VGLAALAIVQVMYGSLLMEGDRLWRRIGRGWFALSGEGSKSPRNNKQVHARCGVHRSGLNFDAETVARASPET